MKSLKIMKQEMKEVLFQNYSTAGNKSYDTLCRARFTEQLTGKNYCRMDTGLSNINIQERKLHISEL